MPLTRDHHPVLLQAGPITLSAALHLPDEKGPHPAVLIIHGYGGNKIGYRRRYIHLARRLGGAGIAALRFDWRGCGESGGLFSSLTFDGLVDDALLALRYLKAHPAISQIGLLGSSLGGPLAIRTAQNSSVRSLALWAAAADGGKWRADWKGSQEELDDHMRCGEEGIPEQLRKECQELKSHLELAQMPGLPVFSAHGQADTLVLPSHQQAYKKARRDNPLDHFLTLPNSNHSFSHDGEREELIMATTHWFQKTLL